MTCPPRARRAAAVGVLLLAGLLTACHGSGAGGSPSGSATGPTNPSGAPASTGTTSTSSDTATPGVSCTYPPAAGAGRGIGTPPATSVAYRRLSLTLGVDATPVGTVTVTLSPTTAPCTVSSVGFLASKGFYDGSHCPRITDTGRFVLQCGDPLGTGAGGPGYTSADELSGSETYPAGTVAMVNDGPGTDGSQFFLFYKDSPLDPAYTVIGRITAGMDVLTGIAARGTAQVAGDGTPAHPVIISRATAT